MIAIPPHEQPALARQMMLKPEVHTLFLEKPLAHTPRAAWKLLETLKYWGGRYRIGYLFSDTKWAKPGIERISWEFMNAHDNWKAKIPVASYYGIHIIALASEMGYTDVAYSAEAHGVWEAEFGGANLPCLKAKIDTRSSKSGFNVFTVDDMVFPTPFGDESRVQVLTRSINRFLKNPQPMYGDELRLWSKCVYDQGADE